ncbi:Tim44 domain-containing protein [Marichromatium bheemlicum]|uniref:Tim44 domain-containing protein n=1 Tax=Marichromatium bheemlicum TaxID=365339 RepID=A0ABX1ID66_9GAMM|nr:Tim44-like domain-containing protein [Marichromatium bheemlicum]NKN34125.1 Tim44 domain-containing protein [Marichromatium bheemlicum]
MTVKTLFTTALALVVVGFLSVPTDVEAKRFGGGASLGKQSSSLSSRPAQRQQQAAQPRNPAAANAQRPQKSGASRWLGPLAGLAAGGLLASLFFGDGFEGFQFMDFLLIALLVFGAVMLFRALRRRQAAGPVPAAAGAHGRVMPGQPPRQAHPGMAGQRRGGGAQQQPSWFNAAGFLEDAKAHYVRLQSAWDQDDMRDIAEYTTPELFAELQRERAKLSGPQSTEVVQLKTELVGVERDGDQVVASILFSGLIREQAQGPAEPFREVWHIQHAWASPAGDWYIAGIQQVEG